MIILSNSENIARRSIYWKALSHIKTIEHKFPKEEIKQVREICLEIWTATTEEDAQIICNEILKLN